MNELYYVAVDGGQTGPYTIEELSKKIPNRDTLVWTKGLDNWTRACDLPMLQDILMAMPPPLPILPEIKAENATAIPEATLVVMAQAEAPITTKYHGYALASRAQRLIGWMIEGVLVTIICLLIWDDEYKKVMVMDGYVLVYNIPVWVLLGAVSYPTWGCNVGQRIMGLQVINTKTGEVERNVVNGALRELLKNLLALLIVPIMWLLWDEDKQNVYDKLLNHYVVKRRKGI